MNFRYRLSFASLLMLAAVCSVPAWAASPPPSRDAFYAPPGSLAKVKPGTVLRSRRVSVALGGGPLTATQVLYRSTNQVGQPSATAATILRPSRALGPVRLLSYQTAYDGMAATCRPSYALQQGDSSANGIVSAEGAIIASYLNQGYTVVTSDYEGPTDDFGAGRESGYGTLDAIRAAESKLGLPAKTTKVALTGYSGGSIASMWAAELQPRYAPQLDLIGVAAGGIPVDFAHNQAYIDGSSDWAGAIPAVGIGLSRAYRVDLTRVLSATGRQIYAQAAKGCLVPSAYPGLKFADLLRPQYQNWRQVPEYVRIFNDTIMGRHGTPGAPLFLAVGNSDGTGDGVMVAKDVQELAHTYCMRGVPVQFHEYAGADHVAGYVKFAPEANAWLAQRFAGQPAPSDCPIAAANALDPLPTPPGRLQLTSGISVSNVHRAHGHYTALIGAPTWTLMSVELTTYRISRSGRKLLVGAQSAGTIGPFGARRVQIPISHPVRGARYGVIVSGQMQTAILKTSLVFLAG